eukprot:COSAG04_NODE_31429_length_257_cov_0.506329_1_plen_53_part_10
MGSALGGALAPLSWPARPIGSGSCRESAFALVQVAVCAESFRGAAVARALTPT